MNNNKNKPNTQSNTHRAVENEQIIPLRSLTQAIKAQKLLRVASVNARVIKPSSKYAEEGCGYGVAVSGLEYDKAIGVLKSNGIAPLNVNRRELPRDR